MRNRMRDLIESLEEAKSGAEHVGQWYWEDGKSGRVFLYVPPSEEGKGTMKAIRVEVPRKASRPMQGRHETVRGATLKGWKKISGAEVARTKRALVNVVDHALSSWSRDRR